MLLDMLRQNVKFQQLPLEKREIFLKLADTFEDNELALHLSPKELTDKLSVGNKDQWFEFLNLEPVAAYINSQMAMQARVAQRAQLGALTREALQGDVAAAKMIENLSGVLNSGDKSKTVVLIRVNRPKERASDV